MIVAVDIGGTKTLIAVFDASGHIVEQIKFPTPLSYNDFKIDLANNVAKLSTETFTKAVIAVPGRIDRTRGVGLHFGNLPWEDVAVQSDVEAILSCPVALENDAKLGALGQASFDPHYKRLTYITISTGIGIGVIANGRVDHGVSDGGGKSMFFEHDGILQPWENFASGKAIFKKYGKQASDINDSAIWDKIVRTWVEGFIAVIALTSPDAIVIGGGVGGHFDKYGKKLVGALQEHQTPMLTIPEILPAKHPEEAVVYGCYAYAAVD